MWAGGGQRALNNASQPLPPRARCPRAVHTPHRASAGPRRGLVHKSTGPSPLDININLSNYPDISPDLPTNSAEEPYFLVMHELCHIWLNHGSVLSTASEDVKAELRFSQEHSADACAIDIVNRDERRYSSSPVSFLGTLLTVSTQLVVNKVLSSISVEEGIATHPASKARLSEASRLAKSYISKLPTETMRIYQRVIDGVLLYFLSLAVDIGAE